MAGIRPQGSLVPTIWLGRLPHWAWALAVCVLVLLIGVAAADDYGVPVDTYNQRAIGEANLQHLVGENGLNQVWPPTDRLYGPALEAPLRLVERILAADDSRSVYLVRYLLTHLFFVAASFACCLLAYRLFGSRWLALFALAVFLLHPRIYAHSFVNSKDVPFLGMFMIFLWLVHRAFAPKPATASSNGTAVMGPASAFALCGVAAGLLVNLRFYGLFFVALVALMCVCEFVTAGSRGRQRSAIVGGLLFALASAGTYYATMPYLWADPLERFIEVVRVMSTHPTARPVAIEGELVHGSKPARALLPVWFGITTPLLPLLLGVVGFGALVWRVGALLPGRRTTKNLLGGTPLGFELLIAACVVVPVLVAFAIRPDLHGDWRFFYFLWAPFALLATFGLKALIDVTGSVFRRLGRPRIPTAIVACLAALALGANAYEMARLHPHQHLYFNALANGQQRSVLKDPFSRERGYAYILEELADREERPDTVFNILYRTPNRKQRRGTALGVGMDYGNTELFRERDQQRFAYDRNADIDFYVITRSASVDEQMFPPLLYERRLYGQPIVRVATPDLSRVDEATAKSYRALYRQVTSGVPALGGDVDVYRDETAIFWVREHCPAGGLNGDMSMTVVPLEAGRGDTQVSARGVRVGDACLWRALLPDFPIAKMLFPRIGSLASAAHLEDRRRRYAELSATPPAARSTFDVYLEDGTLLYIKTPCVQEDTQAPFFVHVHPVHAGDLHRSRRPHGFDTLDFRFGSLDPHWRDASGDVFDDVCMATLELPDYPVASVTTGQYVPGGASLWRVEVDGE